MKKSTKEYLKDFHTKYDKAKITELSHEKIWGALWHLIDICDLQQKEIDELKGKNDA